MDAPDLNISLDHARTVILRQGAEINALQDENRRKAVRIDDLERSLADVLRKLRNALNRDIAA